MTSKNVRSRSLRPRDIFDSTLPPYENGWHGITGRLSPRKATENTGKYSLEVPYFTGFWRRHKSNLGNPKFLKDGDPPAARAPVSHFFHEVSIKTLRLRQTVLLVAQSTHSKSFGAAFKLVGAGPRSNVPFLGCASRTIGKDELPKYTYSMP